MTTDDSSSAINPRAATYGEALRRLRRQGGVSQVDAARAAGLSQAAWTKYERGRTLAFLNLLNQDRCVRALGRTLDELEAMRVAIEAGGAPAAQMAPVYAVHEDGGRFEPWPAPPAEAHAFEVAGTDMRPYVEPGESVSYSPSQNPRPGRGVVLKTRDGQMRVRRYVRTTADGIVCARLEAIDLDGRQAWVEYEEHYASSEVSGLYAILARRDD